MCGIWCCIGYCPTNLTKLSVNALKDRGPEGTQIEEIEGFTTQVTLGFTRLAINGLNPDGMQPMKYNHLTWVCNGEIYNWKELAKSYGIECKSGSDCELLGPLFEKFCDLGIPLAGFFRALDGVFAMCIVDSKRNNIVVARDPYGVRPLYMGQRYIDDSSQQFLFASELKGLTPICNFITSFEPGFYQMIEPRENNLCIRELRRYHTNVFVPHSFYLHDDGLEHAMIAVRRSMENAVRKRLMTERPIAALLSGGLDSSIVAALLAKELRKAKAAPLKTFSIGFKGSSDLAYARKVADWIGSEHTEIVATPEDFFNAISAVIYAIESYDTTTVRASVGNWFLGKVIKEESDCKVVFNGDGSDELWGSYLYFNNAPSDHAYNEEVGRLLDDIHLFDVLRSDRCISSHGLEPRTPFLDKDVVATVRSLPVNMRRPILGKRPEKWLLRKAFEAENILPDEVLWRRKEAFSDGVSGTDKSWYQILQEKVQTIVPKNWQKLVAEKYSSSILHYPKTEEQYFYRTIFEKHFGNNVSYVNVPFLWMPTWCKGATDPSARTLPIYSTENPST